MFTRHKEKEGNVKPILSSRRWLIIFVILLLIMALTACERPLHEEEEAAPETGVPVETLPEVQPETTPEGAITVPGVTEEAPPAGETPTEGGQPAQPAEGSVEIPVTPAEGETTQPAEPVQPAESPAPQTTTLPTGEQIHIVQAGENLFRIGLRYGIDYHELAAYNGIPNPHFISVGQVIRIPPSN